MRYERIPDGATRRRARGAGIPGGGIEFAEMRNDPQAEFESAFGVRSGGFGHFQLS